MKLLLPFLFASGLHAQVWLQLPDFPGERRDDGVAVLSGNKAYFGTGLKDWWIAAKDFYALDLSTYQWSSVAPMPDGAERQYACAFSSGNGFYVFGGDANGALNSMFQYHAATNSWSTAASKPGAGLIGASCMVFGDKAVITGGKTAPEGPASTQVWEYDMSAGTWLQKNDFPFSGRWRSSAAVLNNQGYLMFGKDDSSTYRNEIFRYHKNNDQWTQLADFPHGAGRAYCALQASQKKLVLFGGHAEHNTYLNDVWFFNDTLDLWTGGPSLPAHARRGDMSCIAGDRFIFSCGLGPGDVRLSETWMMDVPLANPVHHRTSGFKVFPQPVNDLLQISQAEILPEMSVLLTGITGKILLSQDLFLENTLDLRFLENGIYLLHIYSSGHLLLAQKLIKE